MIAVWNMHLDEPYMHTRRAIYGTNVAGQARRLLVSRVKQGADMTELGHVLQGRHCNVAVARSILPYALVDPRLNCSQPECFSLYACT